MRKRFVCGVLAALLVVALGVGASAAEAPSAGYIVVLKSASAGDPGSIAREHADRFGLTIDHVYQHALNGYSAFIPTAFVSAISSDPRVELIERDQLARISATQTSATWGLDRIDQANLPLSTTYSYANTGAGVTAYVIDTGLKFSHSEFTGRATSGYDAIDGGSADDCEGHGTHVAGTVGGTKYGVAKGVNLVIVRVLDCLGSGSYSQVIAGVDWVTGHHAAGAPAVANMSLGGGTSSALDTAVRNSINDGVSYAIAAGNGNILGWAQDACTTSPARVAEALTMGATDKTDKKASFSNYGNCVDWFAPGVSIVSAGTSSNTATATLSGTSMASPHTAGVAALYLQSNPSASPAAVRTALFNLTTKGKVTSANTANNHLLFTNM
ncbi:MAG TPA: S8 family peptidase [Actinomycetota bacterium]|nr:S8 family peptidase [Actinomycetota bacterium]